MSSSPPETRPELPARFRLGPVVLRVGVSLLLLAALLWLVPVRQVISAVGRVPPALWLASLVVFLLGHVVGALKWWVLIRTEDTVPVPFPALLRAHFLGLASNLFLPGLVGGDLVRVAVLKRRTGSWENPGVAMVTDRLLDTGGLLILAVAGALSTVGLVGPSGRILAAASALLAGALLGVSLVYRRLRQAEAGTSRRKIADAIAWTLRRPGRAAAATLLSMAMQASFILVTAFFGRSAGVDVSWGAWFVSWPMAKLAALVPLTLAGVGTREGALVLMMQSFGGEAPQVAAAGILWTSVLICGAALGGIVALLAPGGAGVPAGPRTHDEPGPGSDETAGSRTHGAPGPRSVETAGPRPDTASGARSDGATAPSSDGAPDPRSDEVAPGRG